LLKLATDDLVHRISHPSALFEAPTSSYSPTPFFYLDRDINVTNSPSYSSDHGARVDHNPYRYTEAYFPWWSDYYEWNQTCSTLVMDSDNADYPEVDGCLIPQSGNLTLLCPSLYPSCPSPSQAQLSPQSYAQWKSNSSNGYCPPFCLDPLRFGNSLSKVSYHQIPPPPPNLFLL
jgi:hypothetical protein